MQVNLTVNIRDDFLGSCWLTIIHRVTAIYRAVIYRFDCNVSVCISLVSILCK